MTFRDLLPKNSCSTRLAVPTVTDSYFTNKEEVKEEDLVGGRGDNFYILVYLCRLPMNSVLESLSVGCFVFLFLFLLGSQW